MGCEVEVEEASSVFGLDADVALTVVFGVAEEAREGGEGGGGRVGGFGGGVGEGVSGGEGVGGGVVEYHCWLLVGWFGGGGLTKGLRLWRSANWEYIETVGDCGGVPSAGRHMCYDVMPHCTDREQSYPARLDGI